MLFQRTNKWTLGLLLSLAGAGYFASFALLDVHPVLKNQLVLLPIQIGVLIYFLWWRPRQSRDRS